MKSEKTVEIDCAVRFGRALDRNRAAQIVVFILAVGDDHIQPVNRAALENHDQSFLSAERVFTGLSRCELVQKLRRRAHQTETRQSDAARFQKISSIHKSKP